MTTTDLPTPVFQPYAWQDKAACTGRLDMFFPTRGGDQVANTARAKALCATCPVIEDCREYALNDASLQGIWGGMTDRERKHERMRTQRGVLVRCRHCRDTFYAIHSLASRCAACKEAGHRDHGEDNCALCKPQEEDWYHALMHSAIGRRFW